MSTLADDPAARREWVGRHLLVPLVLGLGNTAGEPEVFTVGLPEQPLLTMPTPLFEVWARGTGFADLGSVVRWYSRQAAGAGQTDVAVTDPDQLLAAVVGGLHRFLSVRAAHLDVTVLS